MTQALEARSGAKDQWLADAVSVLTADDRVAAVWVFGSEGRGESDGLSDIDICVAFFDADSTELDRIPSWLRRLGTLMSSKEAPYNAPQDGRYFAARYPARPVDITVDSYWQPLSAAAIGSDTKILVDKVDLSPAVPARLQIELFPSMRDGLAPSVPSDPLEALQSQVEWFWFMVTIVAKHLARGWDTASEVAMLWAVVDNTARYVGAPVLESGIRPDGLRPLLEEMKRIGVEEAVGLPTPVERANAYSWLELAETLVAEGWTPGPGGG